MAFGLKRFVHASTKQEVDAALASADRVVVEGDDQLLSYAINKASGNPDIEVTVDRLLGTFHIDPLTHVSAAQIAAHDVPHSRRLWAGIAAAVTVALVAGAVELPLRYTTDYVATTAPEHPGFPINGGDPPTQSGSAPTTSLSPPPRGDVKAEPEQSVARSDAASILQALAWPAVAVVAILALFFIARQAVAGNRNVEISWKVTEKVGGRVVITKVRERSTTTSKGKVAA